MRHLLLQKKSDTYTTKWLTAKKLNKSQDFVRTTDNLNPWSLSHIITKCNLQNTLNKYWLSSFCTNVALQSFQSGWKCPQWICWLDLSSKHGSKKNNNWLKTWIFVCVCVMSVCTWPCVRGCVRKVMCPSKSPVVFNLFSFTVFRSPVSYM